MRLTNASISAHCASSQVNTCHAVPTTGFLRKLSLLGYITKQLTERNTHDVASTVELQLSRLIGTASHPAMLKIRIIGFVFENTLHWQFEVWLLLFTVCTCVSTFRPCLMRSSRSHNTVLYRGADKSLARLGRKRVNVSVKMV